MLNQTPLLVTGAAGFIGARFVELANQKGYPLVSVDLQSHFHSRSEHRHVEFGRIVDRHQLLGWLASERPPLSGIVHLGACTDTTEMDVAKLTRWNLEFSQALWEYAARERLPFVYASSAATFGAGEQGYSDDESLIPRLHPLNPYGDSKQRFDIWALEQEKKGHCPPSWAGFKFFNVYGFGERHKQRMASVALHAFDQIRSDGVARLFKSYRPDYADGEQRRDFVYVNDVVDILRFALEKPIRRGIYNLGTGQARSFLDLVRAVFKGLGKPERIQFIDMPPGLAERYQYFTQAEMKRLRAEGYDRPFTSLEAGVADYVKRLTNA